MMGSSRKGGSSATRARRWPFGDAHTWFTLQLEGTNMCLDISQGKAKKGAKIIVWTNTGAPNQLFRYNEALGTYESKLAPGLVLDIPGAKTKPGLKLITWDEDASAKSEPPQSEP